MPKLTTKLGKSSVETAADIRAAAKAVKAVKAKKANRIRITTKIGKAASTHSTSTHSLATISAHHRLRRATHFRDGFRLGGVQSGGERDLTFAEAVVGFLRATNLHKTSLYSLVHSRSLLNVASDWPIDSLGYLNRKRKNCTI